MHIGNTPPCCERAHEIVKGRSYQPCGGQWGTPSPSRKIDPGFGPVNTAGVIARSCIRSWRDRITSPAGKTRRDLEPPMVHGEVALRFALSHFSTSAGLPSNGLSRFGRVVSVAIGLMTASSRRLECVHFLQAATRFRPLRQLFHFANVATLPLVGQKLALVHKGEETALMSACVIAAQLVMLPVALLVNAEADA